MSIYEIYAEDLFRALPQPTREAICEAMRVVWRNMTVSIVDQTLLWIRENPEIAGFNVSFAKRGTPGLGEGDRFFVINKDDPSFQFSQEQRDHFDAGFKSMIQSMATSTRNADGMLEAAMVHEGLRLHRDALADLREDIAACFRRAVRLQRDIKKKQNL